MGPGGAWWHRARRASMIAAGALALAGWAFAFPVAFRGLESARPSTANQPRNAARVAVVHLRRVDISIRNESTRSKHASASQRSGAAAAAAAKVASGGSSRIDSKSPKTRTVKAPAKPRKVPSPKPALQPVSPNPAPEPVTTSSPSATTSPVATELSPAVPAASPAETLIGTSPDTPALNGDSSGSGQTGHDRSEGRNGDQGRRKEGDRQPDHRQDCSSRPGRGDRSAGHH